MRGFSGETEGDGDDAARELLPVIGPYEDCARARGVTFVNLGEEPPAFDRLSESLGVVDGVDLRCSDFPMVSSRVWPMRRASESPSSASEASLSVKLSGVGTIDEEYRDLLGSSSSTSLLAGPVMGLPKATV